MVAAVLSRAWRFFKVSQTLLLRRPSSLCCAQPVEAHALVRLYVKGSWQAKLARLFISLVQEAQAPCEQHVWKVVSDTPIFDANLSGFLNTILGHWELQKNEKIGTLRIGGPGRQNLSWPRASILSHRMPPYRPPRTKNRKVSNSKLVLINPSYPLSRDNGTPQKATQKHISGN